MVSYIVAILCRLHNRNYGSVYGNLNKPPPFFLGKIGGNIINILALMFLVCFLVSGTFPVAPKPTLQSMNWSSMVLGAVFLFAMGAYFVRGHKYLGPNVAVPRDIQQVTVETKDAKDSL